MSATKIPALIVDDEPLARDAIRIMLETHVNIALVGECRNGNEAVQAIQVLKPALVFLDVQMPDLDGFGVVQQVGIENMPVVIFVTAYDRYAMQAFEVHALDYLLKPFDQERFDHAVARAVNQIEGARSGDLNERLMQLLQNAQLAPQLHGKPNSEQYLKRLVLKESGRIFFAKTDEIDWIAAAGDYVNLHLGRESHLLHETMSGLEPKLDPAQFVRIHRSTLVNIERIREMQPHANGEYFVFLKDGTKLKLSRTYRDKLKILFGESA